MNKSYVCGSHRVAALHIAQKCIISTHHAITFRKIVFREKCVVREKQIIYLCVIFVVGFYCCLFSYFWFRLKITSEL